MLSSFKGCEPGANVFVETHFHDCVYTHQDAAGFGLGMASILAWLVAQMPQFIDNIKNQSAEALSVWFLAQWFGGDTLNLLGCLIQGQQLPTTTFLAMYFVLSDVVMLVQFIYYSAVQKRKEAAKRLRRSMRKAGSMSSGLPSPSRHHRHHHHHPLGNSSGQGSQAVLPGLGSFISTDNGMLSLPGGMEGTVSQNSSGALVVVASQGNTAHGSDAEQQEVAVTLASAPGTLRLRSAQGAAGTSVATALFAVASSASSLAAHYAAYTHGRTSHGATGALGALHATPQHALSAAAGSSASSSSLGNYKLLGSGSEAGPSSSAHSSSFYVQGQKCSFVNCDVALVAGTAMGYLATILYLGSRVSQIVKNRQRQSAEGLSILMFVLTITANLCTGFSIVLRLHDSEALKDQLPWLCGTFGTIALDVTLFYQTLTYGRIAAAHAAAQGAHKQEGDVHGHHHHHHHHHHAHGRHQGSHAFSNPASSKNTGETSATGMFASMPVLGSLAPSNDRSGQQNDLEAPLLLNSHASD